MIKKPAVTKVAKQAPHIVLSDKIRQTIIDLNHCKPDTETESERLQEALFLGELALEMGLFQKIIIPTEDLAEILNFLRGCQINCHHRRAANLFTEEFFAAVKEGNTNPIIDFFQSLGDFSSDDGLDLLTNTDLGIIREALELESAMSVTIILATQRMGGERGNEIREAERDIQQKLSK
ncbi:MAG: hypothetical protein HGA87_07175 [Desulfobulbaceae bacterium]|nr:hypothetical protein [Desulfobulbaceae bacterium]